MSCVPIQGIPIFPELWHSNNMVDSTHPVLFLLRQVQMSSVKTPDVKGNQCHMVHYQVVILRLALIHLFSKNLFCSNLTWLVERENKNHRGRKTCTEAESHSHITVTMSLPVSTWSDLLAEPPHVVFLHLHAISSQNIITRATNRKSRERNCSSMCCGVPGAAVWWGNKFDSYMTCCRWKIHHGDSDVCKA